jgi:hypothetical protein
MVEPSTCNYNSPIRLQASDDTDVPAYFRFAAFGKPYNLNYAEIEHTSSALAVDQRCRGVNLSL